MLFDENIPLFPKIIVIRGPSAAGKSTTACALIKKLRNDNVRVCYFDLDYFRLKIPGYDLDELQSAKLSAEMLFSSIKIALKQKFHVVLEGLLARKHFGDLIDTLQAEHPMVKFYFRVSFEETLRRHATREKRKEFGEKEMRGWYPIFSDEIFDDITIEESSTLEQSVEFIRTRSEL